MASREEKVQDFAKARIGAVRPITSRVLFARPVVQPRSRPRNEPLYLCPPKAYTAKQTPPLSFAPPIEQGNFEEQEEYWE